MKAGEASRFVVERIQARAAWEGYRLSAPELSILNDPGRPLGGADDPVTDEAHASLASLLRRSYEADLARDAEAKGLYRAVDSALSAGDGALSGVVAEGIGLEFEAEEEAQQERLVDAKKGSLLLSLLPGTVALFMGGALAWHITRVQQTDTRSTVTLVGLAAFLIGYGAFQIRVWSRYREK